MSLPTPELCLYAFRHVAGTKNRDSGSNADPGAQQEQVPEIGDVVSHWRWVRPPPHHPARHRRSTVKNNSAGEGGSTTPVSSEEDTIATLDEDKPLSPVKPGEPPAGAVDSAITGGGEDRHLPRRRERPAPGDARRGFPDVEPVRENGTAIAGEETAAFPCTPARRGEGAWARRGRASFRLRTVRGGGDRRATPAGRRAPPRRLGVGTASIFTETSIDRARRGVFHPGEPAPHLPPPSCRRTVCRR